MLQCHSYGNEWFPLFGIAIRDGFNKLSLMDRLDACASHDSHRSVILSCKPLFKQVLACLHHLVPWEGISFYPFHSSSLVRSRFSSEFHGLIRRLQSPNPDCWRSNINRIRSPGRSGNALEARLPSILLPGWTEGYSVYLSASHHCDDSMAWEGGWRPPTRLASHEGYSCLQSRPSQSAQFHIYLWLRQLV